MAFLDKINDFAKTATEKTNNAIEITKLTAKIEAEHRNLNAIIQKIGEYYVAKIDAGETLDEEVMSMFTGVKDSRNAIAEMRMEIEMLKSSKTVSTEKKLCSNCGKELSADARFCIHCGTPQE